MADTLRGIREQMGLSIEAMGEKTDFSAGALSLYERGLRIPKPEQAERLAKGYGLPAEVVRYMCIQAKARHSDGLAKRTAVS